MGQPLVAAEDPIRVAVAVSTGAERLRYLLEHDSNRGDGYELVGGFANAADSPAADLLAAHDVPVRRLDIHSFCEERGAGLNDDSAREAFDRRMAEALDEFDPDLVVLCGYLHVVTAPVLDRFFPRIVNSHHADLTVRDGSGEPVYTGLESVRDALRAGEPTTRETTHVVTEAVDRGPPIARSPPFSVHRDLVESALAQDADDVFDAYAYAHRQWMIRAGGGPTLAKTIELVADGRVTYDGNEVAVDGEPGVYDLDDRAVGEVIRDVKGDT